jgi:hypothetical protein
MRNTANFWGIIALVAVIGFSIVACDDSNWNNNGNDNNNGSDNNNGNDNNNGSDNNNGNVNQPPKFTVGYLSNLMVDIGDAAALGIRKKPVTHTGNARAVTGVEEIVEKNYLVKITTDVSQNNGEWDESGITNVTFKKKTTVDTTVYMPVYDEEGNPVYLTDGEGNPLLDDEGEPIVEMQVIEDRSVTQDEIPAQVNKLYVYNSYTFIQFVPVDTQYSYFDSYLEQYVSGSIPDIRPDDLGKPDRTGYYNYDKFNYYNDDFHQSFVIENSTGNIYSLEDTVYIDNIHNGLLKIKDSPYIWDCLIKDNNELEIFSLFQNVMISVIDYYKDKYGNNFIYNRNISQTVTEINTIFFSQPQYHASLSGEVLYIKAASAGYSDNYTFTDGQIFFNSWSIEKSEKILQIVGPNCTTRNVAEADDLIFYGSEFGGGGGGYVRVSHIKNKKLWLYGVDGIWVLDTDTGGDWVHIFLEPGRFDHNATAIRYDTFIISYPNKVNNNNRDWYFYTVDLDLLPTDPDWHYSQESNYSMYSYGEGSTGYWNHYSPPAETLLFDNVDGGVQNWKKTTLEGQVEYTIAFKEINGKEIPYGVKVSEYVAEEQQVITLKPINR